MVAPDTSGLVDAIHNRAWLVRNCSRPSQREQRAAAIRQLGLACRSAFNTTEDFEPLFQAILDGLIPKEEPRF